MTENKLRILNEQEFYLFEDKACFKNPVCGCEISVDFVEKLTLKQLRQAIYYLQNRVTYNHRI